MIAGTAFGVVLNDRAEREALGEALGGDPYKAPPEAPVVYIKPRSCFAPLGAPIELPTDLTELSLAATVGLIFARELSAGDPDPLGAVGSACLALEVSEPHSSYYRPAIRQRCRDGFLPLGATAAFERGLGVARITTFIDRAEAHRWSLDRLVRPIETLVADLATFMSFSAGDLLLVGVPGDAPRFGAGADIVVEAVGLPTLRTRIVAEARP